MSVLRVVLIEDNRVVRERIAARLDAQPDFEVTAAVRGDAAAVQRSLGTKPQLVLLDLGVPNSVQVVRTVKERCPDARVVMMGLVPTGEHVIECVQAGVAGFIMNDATLNQYVKTIRSVRDGASVLPRVLTRSLFSELAQRAVARGRGVEAARLTPRERQVMQLLGEGLTNKELAQRLHIGVHTIKSHVHNIMEKLGLHTRLEIALHAQTPGRSARTTP